MPKLIWDEFIAKDSDSDSNKDVKPGVDCLGRTRQNFESIPKKIPVHSYLEITLNHPQTKSFLKMNSTKQKSLYHNIWNCMKNEFSLDPMNNFVYEYTKTGQVHLHGYIKLPMGNFFIAGAISDIVKRYLNLLPKKYSLFDSKNYYPEYERYRCPSICVQYTNDIAQWIEYMGKAQDFVNK